MSYIIWMLHSSTAELNIFKASTGSHQVIKEFCCNPFFGPGVWSQRNPGDITAVLFSLRTNREKTIPCWRMLGLACGKLKIRLLILLSTLAFFMSTFHKGQIYEIEDPHLSCWHLLLAASLIDVLRYQRVSSDGRPCLGSFAVLPGSQPLSFDWTLLHHVLEAWEIIYICRQLYCCVVS